jgi:hypothetical protein
MVKKFLVCLLMLACVSLCAAQEAKKNSASAPRPDLSGTWVFDAGKSKFGNSSAKLMYDSLTLIIAHHEPKVEITRKLVLKGQERTEQLTYYSDGRGEKNTLPEHQITTQPKPSKSARMNPEVVESQTAWNGRKLVTRSFHKFSEHGETLEAETIDKWELSPDGNTLTQVTSFRPPRPSVFSRAIVVAGDVSDIKKVYKRVP